MAIALSQTIKELAKTLGFHQVGIAPAKILPQSQYLNEWLRQGCHGQMAYMANHLAQRLDIAQWYPPAKSVICVAHNYYMPDHHGATASPERQVGQIARYAWGRDYHKVITKKLKELLREIQKVDGNVEGKIAVDSAPVMEKLWAQEAGIGWQGKNSNIISTEYGSWIFLGELIVNQVLEYDQPARGRCGSCQACLHACPTQAITAPYRLDARRCISYLTIELRAQKIPADLACRMGNWVFGCDMCQTVCPWNRSFAKQSEEPDYTPRRVPQTLNELAQLDAAGFLEKFQGTPVMRSKWENFLRNVRIAMDNG